MPIAPDVTDSAATSVFDADTNGSQGQWAARPVLAGIVRWTVLGLPVALSIATAVLLARLLPEPSDGVGLWSQRMLIVVLAGGVAWVSGPFVRRLLPLSALLHLTLVFPDEAPTRMATALQARSTEGLAELIATTKRAGLPSDSAEAATAILRLVGELSRHDRITRGHSERVRAYAALIGQEMGLSQERVDNLGWAGLLHDIGKLTVDDAILNKPGRLTDGEYDIIKGHAAAGEQMVEPLRGWLGDATDAVGQHHERWDGGGYPNGLKGEEISLEARIMAVADVFDVITAARSYKSPSSPAEAREEIARHAGTQFDPAVVRAFLSISVGDLPVARSPLAMLAQWPIVASLTIASPMPALGVATAATAAIGASAAMPAVNIHDYLSDMRAAAASAVVESVDPVADPLPALDEVSAEPEPDVSTARVAPPVATSAGVSQQLPTAPGNAITPAEASDKTPASVSDAVASPTATRRDDGTKGTTDGSKSNDGTKGTTDGSTSNDGTKGTTDGSTSSDGDSDAEFEAEVAAAEEEARADRREVAAELSEELAKIDAKDDAEVAKAHAKFDEDTVDAREQRRKDEADLVEDRAERDQKIAEIDEKLAADLRDLREQRDEDLAAVDQEQKDGDISKEEAAQERAEIRAEYEADVADEKSKAQADRKKEQDKVAEAEREMQADYDEATADAAAERDESLADNAAEREAERAKARQDAQDDRAEIDAKLAEEIRKLEEHYGR